MTKPPAPKMAVGGFLGVLTEALRLPFKNPKLVLSVILVAAIPCNLALMVAQLILRPLVEYDLTSLLPMIPDNVPADRRILYRVEPVAFFLSLLPIIVMLYLAAAVYIGKPLLPAEVLQRVGGKWKQMAITLTYTQLLTHTTAAILSAGSIYVGFLRIYSPVTALISLSANSIVFAIGISLLYLGFICELSLMVSVAEEECYGLPAIKRSWRLIRGRKVHALVTVLLFLLLEEVSDMVLGINRRKEWKQVRADRICVEIFVAVPAQTILQMFECSVLSMFYYDCKKGQGIGDGGWKESKPRFCV